MKSNIRKALAESALSRRRVRALRWGSWLTLLTRPGYYLRGFLVVFVFFASFTAAGLLIERWVPPNSSDPWAVWLVLIPFIALFAGVAAYTSNWVERERDIFLSQSLRNRRGRPYLCHACGYDLRRMRVERCPECGNKVVIEPKLYRERWRVSRGRWVFRGFILLIVILFTLAWIALNGTG